MVMFSGTKTIDNIHTGTIGLSGCFTINELENLTQ